MAMVVDTHSSDRFTILATTTTPLRRHKTRWHVPASEVVNVARAVGFDGRPDDFPAAREWLQAVRGRPDPALDSFLAA